MGAIGIRIQGITLWLRRVPVVPRGFQSAATAATKKESTSREHRSDASPLGHNRFRADGRPWRGCPAGRSAPQRALSRTGCSAARRHGCRSASCIPDGTVVGAADPTLPTMVVHRPEAMVRRVGRYGLIGFGESYMAGDWSSTDIAGLLTEFGKRLTELIPPVLQRFRPLAVVRQPRSQHNSRRAGAAQHRRTLRPVQRPVRRIPRRDHDVLQRAVRRHCPPTSRLSPTHSAARSTGSSTPRASGRAAGCSRSVPAGANCASAPRRGAPTSVRSRLSAEQQRLARQRVAEAGLSDRVEIDLCDYRDIEGRYDAVVSVEMVEAVGYRFWPTYFQTLDRLVAPGGRVAIQAITMPHDRMLASRNTYTWIQKYIFPGGLLPSTEAIIGITESSTRLRTVDMFSLRPHYAETLRMWRERFVERRDAVAELGFDDVFQRMWELYLAYSEAGFRSGYLDVYQWTFAPSGRQR